MMDKNELNELILQKLTTIESELKDVRTELSTEITNVRTELSTEIANVRTELDRKISDVQIEIKATHQDITDLKVSDARTDAKLDTFITNAQEHKADKNERWKIAGIIVSCGVAVISLIISIFS